MKLVVLLCVGLLLSVCVFAGCSLHTSCALCADDKSCMWVTDVSCVSRCIERPSRFGVLDAFWRGDATTDSSMCPYHHTCLCYLLLFSLFIVNKLFRVVILTFFFVFFFFFFLPTLPSGDIIESEDLDGSLENGRWKTLQSNNIRSALAKSSDDSSISAFDGLEFAWFGSSDQAMFQEIFNDKVQIPVEATHLSFYVLAHCANSSKSALYVLVDRNVVAFVDSRRSASFAFQYHDYNVDIADYADGKKHTIQFRYHNVPNDDSTDTFFLVDGIRFIKSNKRLLISTSHCFIFVVQQSCFFHMLSFRQEMANQR